MKIEEYNKKLESCYMLGILPYGEVLFPIDRNSYNKDQIAIDIKPISIEPLLIENEINKKIKKINNNKNYYVAIDDEQKRNYIDTIQGYNYKDFPEKNKIWEEKLKNTIICFKPTFTKDPNNPKNIIKKAIIEFEEPFEGNKSNYEYVSIPVSHLDNERFEIKLLQGQEIELEDYNYYLDQPEYIICGNYIYFSFKTWDKKEENSYGWIHSRETKGIKKLKIDIEIYDHILASNNLIFMERKVLQEIETNKNHEKIDLDLFESYYSESKKEALTNNPENNSESEFLSDLKNETLRLGLSYKMDDLVNLHTCVKTNPLTILSGMSGTGKSKLASIYSEFIGCSENDENLLFLPINPSYTEPGDLLGYLNNITGIYTPSDTRLVDFLNHANDEKDKMHIVIFDEMNLSQVEYWFAPFISLLEREAIERNLYLYNPESNCINRKQYKPYIHIGENIRFIGTVNVDETTKEFSDRLLDRANIIILEKQTFKTLKSEIEEFNENASNEEAYNNICKNKGVYLDWINDSHWFEPYNDIEIDFLDELHKIINKYDDQKGVSFRIIEKIGDYLNNIPRKLDGELLLDRSKAFDLQINQRIITKLKGTEQQFGKLIGTINSYGSDEIIESELLNFIVKDEWKEISDFTLTKKEIRRKAKELGVYGYAN